MRVAHWSTIYPKICELCKFYPELCNQLKIKDCHLCGIECYVCPDSCLEWCKFYSACKPEKFIT